MTTKPTTPDATDATDAAQLAADAANDGAPVTLTEAPAPELVITQHVKHTPTGNLGTITGLAPDAEDGHGNPEPLAQVEWTAGGSTGTSMVPLTELVPDGATVTPITAKAKREAAKAAREEAKAKVTAASEKLGTEPGNAKDRARFGGMTKTAARQLRGVALATMMESGLTPAKAWTAALDAAGITAPEPAEPKAAKTPATPRVAREHAGVAVDGYTVRWPHPAYDLLVTTDKTAERPAWLARCNAHGTTTPVASGKDGDAKGRAAERAVWCPPCKREAAKAARAADTTTPAADASADATPATPAAE